MEEEEAYAAMAASVAKMNAAQKVFVTIILVPVVVVMTAWDAVSTLCSEIGSAFKYAYWGGAETWGAGIRSIRTIWSN